MLTYDLASVPRSMKLLLHSRQYIQLSVFGSHHKLSQLCLYSTTYVATVSLLNQQFSTIHLFHFIRCQTFYPEQYLTSILSYITYVAAEDSSSLDRSELITFRLCSGTILRSIVSKICHMLHFYTEQRSKSKSLQNDHEHVSRYFFVDANTYYLFFWLLLVNSNK